MYVYSYILLSVSVNESFDYYRNNYSHSIDECDDSKMGKNKNITVDIQVLNELRLSIRFIKLNESV